MRFFLTCLGIAAVSLIPFGAHHFKSDLPTEFELLFLPLTAGLSHMAVAFHECGHAVVYWLFGTPALPYINFDYGGGSTWILGRSTALLVGIYVGLFLLGLGLAIRKKWRLTAYVAAFTAIHALFIWRGWDTAVGILMGNGGAILVACWCIWRALDVAKKITKAERYICMIFGLHVFGRAVLGGLAQLIIGIQPFHSSLMRDKPVATDLSSLAEELHISEKSASSLFVLFFLLCVLGLLAMLWRRHRPVITPGIKIFAISLAIAAVSLIPYTAHQFLQDIPMPLEIFLLPLSEGLHYMAVVFHETGHALTYWLFGTPALPALDFHQGGGSTYSFGRSAALMAGIYGFVMLLFVMLARAGKWRGVIWLEFFTALHLTIVMRGWDGPIGAMMGHGAEILAACWCIWRATDQKQRLAERYVGMVTGLHFVGRTFFLCLSLLTSDMRKLAYGVQKGKRGSADLDVFGQKTGTSMEMAALLLFFLLAFALSVTLRLLYKRGGSKA